eukprot:PhF_6_TR24748/c0_g1_i1/m.33923
MRTVGTNVYNPLHKFNLEPKFIAKTFDEFKTIVTNPGPFRVHYSKDYLDWYWKAYQTKVKNHAKKSSQHTSLYAMPLSSARRSVLEQTKTESQAVMDSCAMKHAMMDVWERQPQYPAVDVVSHVTPFHLHEMLKKFLDVSVSVPSMWLKVVFLSSLVAHRYKDTYKGRFPKLEEAVHGIKYAEGDASTHLPSTRLHHICTALIKKYRVANAIEALVVLECLEKDTLDSLTVMDEAVQTPGDMKWSTIRGLLPSHEQDLFHAENLPLIQCYIFTEMNAWVSTNPFRRHPGAKDVCTLPSTNLSSLPQITPQTFFFPVSTPQVKRLELRLKEAQDMHRHMTAFDDDVIAKNTTYNPKTFRGEIREVVNTKMEKALAQYDVAAKALQPKSPLDEGRPQHDLRNVPIAKPTPYFFARKLKSDPVVLFALSMDTTGAVREKIFQAAKEMFLARRHLHDDKLRVLYQRQSLLTLSLLDKEISRILEKDSGKFSSSVLSSAASSLSHTSHIPFASRQLDEFGSPTLLTRDNYHRKYGYFEEGAAKPPSGKK